jgi:phosphoglycerate dehydrogenase-like enzyme
MSLDLKRSGDVTRPYRVVASGDFLRADGAPAYPQFDFDRITDDPRIDFRFLQSVGEIKPDQIAQADALILSDARISADSFDGGGRLMLIAQFGAGFNHIDLAAATRHGIAVTNTPRGVRRPVAVAILTLIFALTTKLFVKAELARRGPEGWAEVTRHNGIGLTGKILGSIGLGNIGSEMFRLAQPLGMTFLAYDPYASAEQAAALGVTLTDLEDLFRRSDIVCVNCPLNTETRHIVTADRLALMKQTAYLVNTSRGGTVDQPALTDALAARRIAGAALDVFEQEPTDPGDTLLQLDNVIATPHALCWTDELFAGCGREAVQSVMDVLASREPEHVVNRDVLGDPAWRRKLQSLSERTKSVVPNRA